MSSQGCAEEEGRPGPTPVGSLRAECEKFWLRLRRYPTHRAEWSCAATPMAAGVLRAARAARTIPVHRPSLGGATTADSPPHVRTVTQGTPNPSSWGGTCSIPVVWQSCVSRVSVVCQSCVSCVSVVCQACVRRVSVVSGARGHRESAGAQGNLSRFCCLGSCRDGLPYRLRLCEGRGGCARRRGHTARHGVEAGTAPPPAPTQAATAPPGHDARAAHRGVSWMRVIILRTEDEMNET
eukprot:SAG25_NODE_2229_length_1816_cov_1.877111_3_plen_238_part_00